MSQNKIVKWDEINGDTSREEKLEIFLETMNDSYAILQLRHTEETIPERFASYTALQRLGREPDIDHYEVVYIAPLEPYTNLNQMLEDIYVKFNIQHPEDFRGHSLSISDIVAVKQNGKIHCHYVDSVGFVALPEFMKPENYLKYAEMSMEDDYGMIDGIINNGKSAAEEEKASVLERLKIRTVSESQNKSSRQSAERERE